MNNRTQFQLQSLYDSLLGRSEQCKLDQKINYYLITLRKVN